ncbi:hypothetical protein [uncultured Ilyobacter sp.]|uniref:hypothetical protein n=1 Tax=uncultured Ilyobacter sp. TaxID=544433 RepID=UPI0029C0DFBF|nr:hypothetical protein [uncultured Ilyobacter sp.]
MREYIKVKKIKLKDNFTVEYAIEHSEKLEYFNEKMFVKYEEDISNVPESILVIPLLSNLFPICWFLNADLHVNELDETFYYASNNIKDGFQKMYTQIKMGGKVIVNKIIKNSYCELDSAVLFSGGVDSVASYINNEDKNPLLVIAQGADISLEDTEGIELATKEAAEFARENDTKLISIKSNFKDFIKGSKLAGNFDDTISHWWPCVQHGFAFVGLVAPISYIRGISKIYIASSFTSVSDFRIPWGSDPRTDNEIKWGETKVHHDNFNRSRQDKIKQISDFVKRTGKHIKLRVCWESPGGSNCCKCEKCSNTMIGLMLENLDPKEFGFYFSDDIYNHTRKSLLEGKWNFIHDDVDLWDDIKKHVSDSDEREFFKWLKSYDFKDSIRKYNTFSNKLRRKIMKMNEKIKS